MNDVLEPFLDGDSNKSTKVRLVQEITFSRMRYDQLFDERSLRNDYYFMGELIILRISQEELTTFSAKFQVFHRDNDVYLEMKPLPRHKIETKEALQDRNSKEKADLVGTHNSMGEQSWSNGNYVAGEHEFVSTPTYLPFLSALYSHTTSQFYTLT